MDTHVPLYFPLETGTDRGMLIPMPRSEGGTTQRWCDPLPNGEEPKRRHTPGQHSNTITVHLIGHIAVQIQLPLLTATLQLEPEIDVIVVINLVVAAEPEIQHANTPNEPLVLEIIGRISRHRLHTVPNRIVSTICSKTTTTQHRDANTPAAQEAARTRGHDNSSGNDGITIPRDCERHHGKLRNWSCEHENRLNFPLETGSAKSIHIPKPRSEGRHNP